MFLLLSLSIPFVIRTGVIRNAYSAYGSFLLFSEAGGALLAALIAFVAGVVITALILRHRQKNEDESPGGMKDE